MEPNATPEPRVMDTYALVYAFTLLFLVPGLYLLQGLPRDAYTNTYVSLITVPFLLGLAATFFTDSRDGLRRAALRTVVLTPLIALTGVGLVFGLTIAILIPATPLFNQSSFGVLAALAAAALALVAGPLIPALWRRVRGDRSWASIAQGLVLLAALGLIAYTFVLTFDTSGAMMETARKDSLRFFIGALTWYLPAFGFAAGAWRRTGLV